MLILFINYILIFGKNKTWNKKTKRKFSCPDQSSRNFPEGGQLHEIVFFGLKKALFRFHPWKNVLS